MATIAFCDIVEFSQRATASQRKMISELNAVVRACLADHLSGEVDQHSVIALSTGDGMALTMLDLPGAEWSGTLLNLLLALMKWSSGEHLLRVGVHCGAILQVKDVNGRWNVCGETINKAQRVMSAANPHQVLFSDAAKEYYVGRGAATYTDHPFSSADPAEFTQRVSVIAKHGLCFDAYVMKYDGWNAETPRSPARVFYDHLARTTFIADELESLLANPHSIELNVCEQSAFSTFGVVTDPGVARKHSMFDSDIFAALVRQRQALVRLAEDERMRLRLILDPGASPEIELRQHRLEALLNWLEKTRDAPNVDWAWAPFAPPNHLTVANQFSIDGFKTTDEIGYPMSVAHFDRPVVEFAIRLFESAWRNAKAQGQTKDSVIKVVRAMLAQRD